MINNVGTIKKMPSIRKIMERESLALTPRSKIGSEAVIVILVPSEQKYMSIQRRH